jgi:hypothetical protein
MKRLTTLIIVCFTLLIGSNVQAQMPGYGYVQPYQPYPNYQQQTPAQLLEMGIRVLQNYLNTGEFDNPEKVINFLDSQM